MHAQRPPSIDFLEGYAAYELAVEDGRVVCVFPPAGVNSQAGPILIPRALQSLLPADRGTFMR